MSGRRVVINPQRFLDDLAALQQENADLRARAEAAEAKIAAVQALHIRHETPPHAWIPDGCHECSNRWPCPTLKALDPAQVGEESGGE
jgi:hypothetical protein